MQDGQAHHSAVILTDVSKRWPARRSIVRRVASPAHDVIRNASFVLPCATTLAILGENGAGKTTLLKIIAGLAREDGGAVTLFGVSGDDALEPIRRTRVAYSAGERGFYYRLSVRENLRFFATLDNIREPLRSQRIHSASAIVDLDRELDRRFSDLSAGMRQRVALASALVRDADLLLLDEPTRMLDPIHAEQFRAFVRDVLVRDRGKTIIVATNQIQEAEDFGDRVAVIRDSQLISLPDGAGRPDRASIERLLSPQVFYA